MIEVIIECVHQDQVKRFGWKTGENIATGITQGADNLVNSVNNATTNAMDGAKNMAEQVSEKAAEVVNSIGETGSGGAQNNVTTGGRRRIK